MDVRQTSHELRAAWAPSSVRRVLRNRFLRCGVLLTIGIAGSLALTSRIAAVEQARADWGQTTTVTVVVEPIEAGSYVTGSVEPRQVPIAMAPDGAVSSVDSHHRALVALHPGEIVLEQRLTATKGAVAPGHAALTLAVHTRHPLIQNGNLVDIWIVDSANQSSQRVAASVVTLDVSDRDITVAVPNDQVGEVTTASLRPVTVTLVG